MRHALAFVLLANPALADLRVGPADCPPEAIGCFTLSDLAASPGRPVVAGEALVILGLGRGPTGTRDRLMAVDVDLSAVPALGAVTVLDATQTEARGQVEIAGDGTLFAVFTSDERDHLNRNQTTGAIQFFDEFGRRLGRLAAPYGPDWPEGADWSPVDLMQSQVRTHALRIAGGAMALRFGRHAVRVDLADGALTVTDTGKGAGGTDLIALIDDMLGGPGFEQLSVMPGLTALANYPADGTPATLRLAVTEVSDPPDALGHVGRDQRVIEPNPNDYSRIYESLALSPDGRRLAALRLQDTGCGGGPAPYEITVHDAATGERLWAWRGTQTGIAQREITWTADRRLILTEARGALDPPCGPDPAPPAVTGILFGPP